MRERLEEIKRKAIQLIESVADPKQLDELRIRFLGRKGELTAILRNLKSVPQEERASIGKLANTVKITLNEALTSKYTEIEAKLREKALHREFVDTTLPGKKKYIGHENLVIKTMNEIRDIFVSMGFESVDGPEVETPYYNFDALNTPEWHPARDLHDSFYVGDDLLLRTHTSPVQVRVMEKRQPPIRVISPGKAYRRDYDATHLPMFHQVEGLMVDEGISVANMKAVLGEFARKVFGSHNRIRLRPHYFPFTEPSFEVDVSCTKCGGKGCPLCKYTGWLVILGAGMVHIAVLENVGYDTEKWTGFAFGMGVERIAMLKYGVDDIRALYINDLRFIEQF